jgi:hypothetical protein
MSRLDITWWANCIWCCSKVPQTVAKPVLYQWDSSIWINRIQIELDFLIKMDPMTSRKIEALIRYKIKNTSHELSLARLLVQEFRRVQANVHRHQARFPMIPAHVSYFACCFWIRASRADVMALDQPVSASRKLFRSGCLRREKRMDRTNELISRVRQLISESGRSGDRWKAEDEHFNSIC